MAERPKTAPRGIRASAVRKVGPTDISTLAAQVEVALGIRLVAQTPTDTVHGHVSSMSKAAGQPFMRLTMSNGSVVEVDDCPMCDKAVARSQGHACSEVVLYESDQAPNAEHLSRIAKHGLTAAKRTQLDAIIAAHKPPLAGKRRDFRAITRRHKAENAKAAKAEKGKARGK